MDQAQLLTFVEAAVQQMEIPNTSPYVAVFSTGSSGLSFGRMQNALLWGRNT